MLREAVTADTTGVASDPSVGSKSRVHELYRRAVGWIAAERLLLAVLVGSFLARLLVADRNSYWLDEVYSVTLHGTWNANAHELLRVIAENTVYPPIYFVTLFEWMQWFGDSEMATRLLSNIFITLSGFFLYLLIRLGFSRRVAITSVIAFNLMYTVMYYSLETRPYALNIFLATLSSYALLRFLRLSTERGWKHAIVSASGAAFTVVNVTLLLTHYYNTFFWIAQGLAVLLFMLWKLRPIQWLKGVGVVVGLYGLQGIIFLGIWGRASLDAIDRQAASNTIADATELPNPVVYMLNSVVVPNFDSPTVLGWVAVALAAVVIGGAVRAIFKRRVLDVQRTQSWIILYLVIWLALPFGVAYVAFMAAGVARFSARYFVFSVVPVAPLVGLAIERAASWIMRSVRWIQSVSTRSRGDETAGRDVWAVLLSIAVLGTLILPGTVEAVTEPKADWRGSAREIVNIIESNPDSSYAVYETSHRSTPILDYYLARYSDDVRVMGTIPRFEERRGGEFSFENNLDAIAENDFLIVPFIHHRVDNFPRALARLRELYEVQYWEIDSKGKGTVIFSVSGKSTMRS